MANMDELKRQIERERVEDQQKLEIRPIMPGIAIVKPRLVYVQPIPDIFLKTSGWVVCQFEPNALEKPKFVGSGEFIRDYSLLKEECVLNPASMEHGTTALGKYQTISELIVQLEMVREEEGEIMVYARDVSWGELAGYNKGTDDRMIRGARKFLSGEGISGNRT